MPLPQPPDPAVTAYEHALAARCPAKHLEWLNPGILADPVEEFVAAEPRRVQAGVSREYNRLCAHVEFGASCGNAAAIRAAFRLRLTARLAARVCREAYACTAPFECHETKR